MGSLSQEQEGFPTEDVRRLVRIALAEDVRSGDVTTQWTIPADTVRTATLIAKSDGVLAGLPIIAIVLDELGGGVQVTAHKTDGERLVKGDHIADLHGPVRTLLTAERVLLNFLQQLSGCATMARRFQDALGDGNTRVLDTRKTLPGLRTLQKYAVRCGGGTNHRMGLFDMVLIKDNHIAACGGPVQALVAVKQAMAAEGRKLRIEIEVETLEQLADVLAEGTDMVLLDNMDNATLKAAVELARQRAPHVLLEASGNMDLARLRTLADAGLDYVSAGALTHSVPAFDISMRIPL